MKISADDAIVKLRDYLSNIADLDDLAMLSSIVFNDTIIITEDGEESVAYTDGKPTSGYAATEEV